MVLMNNTSLNLRRLGALMLLFFGNGVVCVPLHAAGSSFEWPVATPEAEGLVSSKLNAVWKELDQRHTTAFLVIRNDHLVFEKYADGYSRTKPHFTASLAKALVGGTSLIVAMNDGLVKPDDLASKYIPEWT